MRIPPAVPLLTFVAAFAGCASSTTTVCPSTASGPSAPRPTPIETADGAQAAESPAPPFLLHEAPLPRDFPPPGPIGVVIAKAYPPCRAARVQASALPQGRQDDLFMLLFKHIQKENLAMTAPIEMEFAPSATTTPATRHPSPHPPTSMAFLYASSSAGKVEMDGNIEVLDLPAAMVLSVGVRGSYDRAHFEQGMNEINAWLDMHPGKYEVSGPPRFLGYNSPFVPWFMRYGEVQLPVRAR